MNKDAQEFWEYLSSKYNISLTTEKHKQIIEELSDKLEKYADAKIDELKEIMKQLTIPGVR